MPLNGFNRFDPKYVSIGPKALRDQHFGVASNKCATLRHGGRYGGNLGLDKSQGPTPSPHLKKAQPPSVATVSKEYNQSQQTNQMHTFDGLSTLPQKKSSMKYSDHIANKNESEMKPQSSVYSIETSSSYRSPLPPPPPQQQHLQLQQSNFSSISNNKPKGISILNQPLPEIPQTTVQLPETSRNLHQPLSAANLNQYRYNSLQRPAPKSTNPSRNIPMKEVTKPMVPQTKINPPAPKVVPPTLPPKNRHKDDTNVRNKQNTQTLPTSKSQNLLQAQSQPQSRNQQSTHSTFGYDKGGRNISQLDHRSDQHSSNRHQQTSTIDSRHHHHQQQEQQQPSGVSYVEQYKSNLSKTNYQTMPHQPKRRDQQQQHQHHHSSSNNNQPSSTFSYSNQHQNQHNTNTMARSDGHKDRSKHSNRRDDPPVYYRSLQRGGGITNQSSGNDMYSMTEL